MTVESLAKKDKPEIGRTRTKVIHAMDEIVVSEKTYLTKLQELVEVRTTLSIIAQQEA